MDAKVGIFRRRIHRGFWWPKQQARNFYASALRNEMIEEVVKEFQLWNRLASAAQRMNQYTELINSSSCKQASEAAAMMNEWVMLIHQICIFHWQWPINWCLSSDPLTTRTFPWHRWGAPRANHEESLFCSSFWITEPNKREFATWMNNRRLSELDRNQKNETTKVRHWCVPV